MKTYVIVETRDFIETRDTDCTVALAGGLAKKTKAATVFLAENGVLAARAAYDAPGLRQMIKKGVRVLADQFALAERGIAPGDLAKGVEPAEISFVADEMAAGAAVIWR
ncbi:MAG: DsrE family protein [Pseudomonadota bacterium]